MYKGMGSKFADGGILNSVYQVLQQDLDPLGKWAEQWKIEFNSAECKVLYFWNSN